MAQEVAIAKAALSAALFRSDPNPLRREAVETLFLSIDTTVNECSHQNVQNCSRWVKTNVIPSGSRAALLGRYLLEYSKSLDVNKGQKPSLKRRRLHILYLMSDIMWHATGMKKFYLERVWRVQLPALLALAADFTNCPKHIRKLENLVLLWEKRSFFTSDFLETLRKGLTEGIASIDVASEHVSAALKRSKDAPYSLPKLHGDPSSKWYDLPASTWLAHMEANSTKPMKPDQIVPLQFVPGAPDKALVAAVKELISDVEVLFAKDGKAQDGNLQDIGELGERIVLDEVTGEIVGGETYYGWSRTFCEKMQERKRKTKKGSSNSRSPSRSRSRSPQSDYSRDRSRSPGHKRRRNDSQSPPRRSRPRSHSRDDRGRSYTRSRSRSPSRSLQTTSYQNRPPPPNDNRAVPPPPPSYPQFPSVPPSGDFPVPFPPPTGYTGPWPPVPPAPHMGGHPPQNWFPGAPPPPPHMMGSWGSAPGLPPPPPPSHPGGYNQYQGNPYGRGNGWQSGHGRGGRGGW